MRFFKNLNLLDPPFLARLTAAPLGACPSFVPGTETSPFVGNVLLTTDVEVMAFGGDGHDAVLGNLTIQEASPGDITTLGPLLSLLYISGSLNINFQTALTTLTGLDSLMRVGTDVAIQANNVLSFIGLNALVDIDGSLQVGANPALNTVDDSFLCLDFVGGALSISGNGV